jgi:hypothetical protein
LTISPNWTRARIGTRQSDETQLARAMLTRLPMRTHHIAFYVALVVGIVVAVVLATQAGLLLDLHRPRGSSGILMFLGAASVIVLLVEAIAGHVGDWVDEMRRRPRMAR